ncbi:MAG: hypothetical protein ACK4WC_02710 [Rubrimonas sp.]
MTDAPLNDVPARRDPRRRRSLALRLVFAVPVLGWMLRDMAEGDDQAIMWFAVTVICALACAALLFGLPGLVMGMIGMAVFTLIMVLLVTTG